MQLYNRIKKHEHRFTDTEDMIVDYIVNNKEEVVKLSIQSLADKFFTVPNTIIRLCKKMEYDGFSQLKNNLKEELKDTNKEYKSGFEINIKKTLELIDYDKIYKVSDLIYRSKNIIVYGVGQNTPLCEVLVKDLKPTNNNVSCYNQRHEVLHEIEKSSEQDMVFIISSSGKKVDVLEAAKLAKEKKCKIVALTNICENELQEMADISLYCHSSNKKINGYDISDKVPLMIILRAIVEIYWTI